MYQTKQKNYILDVLKNNKDKHLTALDILDILKENNLSVSQATLYRYLDKLVNDNIVRKYTTSHLSKACYQFIDEECNEHNHFHLICLKCQKLIHLDCEMINSFLNHIEEHHLFKIRKEKVVYYGYCQNCQEVN